MFYYLFRLETRIRLRRNTMNVAEKLLKVLDVAMKETQEPTEPEVLEVEKINDTVEESVEETKLPVKKGRANLLMEKISSCKE